MLITGAGKGIGRATALAFSKEGHRVALLIHSKNDVESLRKLFPEKTHFSVGDVSDEASVKRFVSETASNVSGPVVLVNNASVLTYKSHISDVKTEDWDHSMSVNLRGVFLMMKHVIPLLLARRSGLILNISSGVGRRAAPGWGPYAVSKAGVESLTALAAAEVAGNGVSIVSVNPGGTATRMRAAAFPHEDPATLTTPEEIARFLVSISTRMDDPALNGSVLSYNEWKSAQQ